MPLQKQTLNQLRCRVARLTVMLEIMAADEWLGHSVLDDYVRQEAEHWERELEQAERTAYAEARPILDSSIPRFRLEVSSPQSYQGPEGLAVVFKSNDQSPALDDNKARRWLASLQKWLASKPRDP